MAHLGVFDEDIVSLGATEQVSKNEAFSDDVVGYYLVVSSIISPFESRYYPVYRRGLFDADDMSRGDWQTNLFQEFDEDLSPFPVVSQNISNCESLRPNVVVAGTINFETIKSLVTTNVSVYESLASLAAAKISAVEVIQNLAVGNDSGLLGMFDDDMVDNTAEGDVNQRSVFDSDIPIWFVRGCNFESLGALSGSSDSPVESLMTGTSSLSQTAAVNFESLQSVQQTVDSVYEVALGYVASVLVHCFESLEGIVAPLPALPYALSSLSMFDDDMTMGSDDELLSGEQLFDEDLVITKSTIPLFNTGEFDEDLSNLDNDEINVSVLFDEDLIVVSTPLLTFGIPFESLSAAVASAGTNQEARMFIKNSLVPTSIGNIDADTFQIVPPTGPMIFEWLPTGKIGLSRPQSSRGIGHRRRRP